MPADRVVIITLKAQVPEDTSTGDIGLFLYDLSSLYELLRLALDPAYADYRFGKYPLFRGRHSLQPPDQLAIEQLKVERTLNLRASLFEPAGARSIVSDVLNAFVERLEAISPGLLVDGAPRTAGRARAAGGRIESRLSERGATSHIETVLRRLRHSPIELLHLAITREEE